MHRIMLNPGLGAILCLGDSSLKIRAKETLKVSKMILITSALDSKSSSLKCLVKYLNLSTKIMDF